MNAMNMPIVMKSVIITTNTQTSFDIKIKELSEINISRFKILHSIITVSFYLVLLDGRREDKF
jgi:hypothetical protein